MCIPIFDSYLFSPLQNVKENFETLRAKAKTIVESLCSSSFFFFSSSLVCVLHSRTNVLLPLHTVRVDSQRGRRRITRSSCAVGATRASGPFFSFFFFFLPVSGAAVAKRPPPDRLSASIAFPILFLSFFFLFVPLLHERVEQWVSVSFGLLDWLLRRSSSTVHCNIIAKTTDDVDFASWVQQCAYSSCSIVSAEALATRALLHSFHPTSFTRVFSLIYFIQYWGVCVIYLPVQSRPNLAVLNNIA